MGDILRLSVFTVMVIAAAILTGFSYHLLWQYMLIGLSRSHMFIFSWGIALLVLIVGIVFDENRTIWKGYFVTAEEQSVVYAYAKAGPFPGIPLTLGVMLGILSFMAWS